MSDHVVSGAEGQIADRISLGLAQSLRETKANIIAAELRRSREAELAARQTRNPELAYAPDRVTAKSMARSVMRRAIGRWDGISKGGRNAQA